MKSVPPGSAISSANNSHYVYRRKGLTVDLRSSHLSRVFPVPQLVNFFVYATDGSMEGGTLKELEASQAMAKISFGGVSVPLLLTRPVCID